MLLTIAPAMLLAVTPSAAAELHVGGQQPFATISAAVKYASDGDTIVVHAGTYAEQIVIDDPLIDELTIKAYGTDLVVVDTPDDKVNAVIARDVNLRIKGLVIDAPYHVSPAQVGIRAIIEADSYYPEYTLTLCDTSIVGDHLAGSKGVACLAGSADTQNVVGAGNKVAGFAVAVGGGCEFGGGWDETEVCEGW